MAVTCRKICFSEPTSVYYAGGGTWTSDGTVTKYYAALGRVLAMRQVPAGGGAGTLYYLLSDHLGSASVVTDSTGAVVSNQKYWPYGATRSGGIVQTDKLYTGQQQEPGDGALGLYNYKVSLTPRTCSSTASTRTELLLRGAVVYHEVLHGVRTDHRHP